MAELSTGYSLNPQQLRSFYYAAVCRSFTLAAERIYYSGQPTVSNHVKELEKQLGKLFYRRARGVDLTPRGQVLLELVTPVVEGLEKLRQDFNERCDELPVGQVTVAVSESLGYDFLSGVLKQFKTVHPLVELRVLARPSPQEVVSTGKADFGVASMASTLPELSYTEILWDPLVLIALANHPLVTRSGDPPRLEEISRYPFVRLAKDSITRRMIDDKFAQRALRLKIALEVDRWADVRKAVGLGMGVAIAPRVSLSPVDPAVVPVHTGEEFPRRPYGIVVRRGAYLSPPARELADAIVEACGAIF